MMSEHGSHQVFGYFKWATMVAVAGLLLGAWVGWFSHGTLTEAGGTLLICAVLAILEVSLSFDNAIVNANKLKTMSPIWQKRFLTWGILIAVFGMRIIFPLLIVAIAADLNPIDATILAATRPDEYARIMLEAHLPIAAFGGTFLMMVGLNYFFDHQKEVHWISFIERKMAQYANIRGIEISVVLVLMLVFSGMLDEDRAATFLYASIYGLLTFTVVELIGGLLDAPAKATVSAAKGGLGSFLYLEVLDSSFSFDGVVGAFALTQNLFIIAIGLGVGAMFVRSMTIMLVEKGTLNEFRYLEHGAFYAILILSFVMFLQVLFHIPEVITGLVGASVIGISLWASILHNRKVAKM